MYQQYGRSLNINDTSTIYFGSGPTAGTTSTMYRWVKPKTCSLVYMTCVGSGAGGGGGGASAASTAGAGGEGGGSSSVISLIVPAYVLPDVLYIQCGNGVLGGTGQVQGGAAATAGQNGNKSFISIAPGSSTAANLILVSGNAAPTGGAAASGATAGTAAGAAGSTAGFTQCNLCSLGIFIANAGVAGGNGGAAAAGTSITIMATNPWCTGGAGGGGTNAGTTTNRGGNITGAGIFPTLTQSTTAGAAGLYGLDFYDKLGAGQYPMIGTGGTGGTSNTSAGTGGRGGDGAPGSGGGGGGGTNGAASVAGAGGNGGPGFVIIVAV